MKIEALRKDHIKAGFSCGKPSLDLFLRQTARQFDDKRIGRTFVLVDDASLEVIGYYTLASGNVGFDTIPEGKKLPPKIPVPVVLLGRLAVDARHMGKRLGELLLIHALWRASIVAKHLGVYAVEVDAIDDDAKSFYQKYGFTPLLDDPRHLYLPMKTIEALELDFTEGL